MRTIATVKVFMLLSMFICCQDNNSENHHESKSIDQTSQLQNKKIKIVIQPFEDFPISFTKCIANELKAMYAGVVVIRKPILFPIHTLNQTQTRYRADSLIRYLSSNTTDGFLTIGLTQKDMSTTKGTNKDWGVFGLGYCPGRSCIASSYRLKGENKLEKLFKVAIHELGHTQGLKHCQIKTCLMRDAKGKDNLNDEKEFCFKCKTFLKKSGWELK
jgi:archaemetzincin